MGDEGGADLAWSASHAVLPAGRNENNPLVMRARAAASAAAYEAQLRSGELDEAPAHHGQPVSAPAHAAPEAAALAPEAEQPPGHADASAADAGGVDRAEAPLAAPSVGGPGPAMMHSPGSSDEGADVHSPPCDGGAAALSPPLHASAATAAAAEQDVRAAEAAAWLAEKGGESDGRQARWSSWWRKFGGRVIEDLVETTPLIDAQYLVALAREGGSMSRGQDVPASARLGRGELWRLRRWNEPFSLPVAVLSYPWIEPTHPDRHGVQLGAIAPVLETMVKAAEKGGGGKHATVGVMIDYCCLPQRPRSEEEDKAFERGLAQMHIWYSHPFTHTILLTTTQTDGALDTSTRPYEERGWCYFELKMSSLIKNAELLWDMANFDGNAGSYDRLRHTMKHGREPPMCPTRVEAEMRRRIGEGSLTFSYAADVEPVIAMYKRGFLNAFEGYRALRSIAPRAGTSIFYGHLGWGEAEGKILAEAIRYVHEHCEMSDGPVEITIPGNRFHGEVRDELAEYSHSFHHAQLAPPRLKLVVVGLRSQRDDHLKDLKTAKAAAKADSSSSGGGGGGAGKKDGGRKKGSRWGLRRWGSKSADGDDVDGGGGGRGGGGRRGNSAGRGRGGRGCRGRGHGDAAAPRESADG